MELPNHHIHHSIYTTANKSNNDDIGDNTTLESKILSETIDQLHYLIKPFHQKKNVHTDNPNVEGSQYCAAPTCTNPTDENVEYCDHFYISCEYEDNIIENEGIQKNKVVDILDSISNLLLLFPDNYHHKTKQRRGHKQRQGWGVEQCRLQASVIDRARHEIKNGFGLLLANIGFANVQLLLHWILTTLPALGSAHARELLLEFLPCCLPHKIVNDSSNNDNKSKVKSKYSISRRNNTVGTDIESRHHYQTEERIVSTLCSIVREDSSTQSLLPILVFFSKTHGCFRTTIIAKKVAAFCIQSLPLVSIEDLPLLCKTMFWYLASFDNLDEGGAFVDSTPSHRKKRALKMEESKKEEEEEYADADDTVLKGLEAIRQELKTIQNNYESISNTKYVGINGVEGQQEQHGDNDVKLNNIDACMHAVQEEVGKIIIPFLLNSPRMAKGYKCILKCHFSCHTKTLGKDHHSNKNKNMPGEVSEERKAYGKSDNNEVTTEKQRGEDWILVDGIALLILFNYHPTHRKEIEHMLNSLCRSSAFPFSTLVHTTTTIREPSADDNLKNSYSSKRVSRGDGEGSISCDPSTTSSILLPALIELGLYLMLTPIRHSDRASYHKKLFRPPAKQLGATPTTMEEEPDHMSCFFERYGTHSILSQTHDYIIELYAKLPDEESRGDLISSLLALSSPINFIQTLISPIVTNDNNTNTLDCHPSHEMTYPICSPKKRQRQGVVGSRSSGHCSNVKFSNQQMDSMPHRLQRLLRPPQCPLLFKYKLRDVYDIAIAALWITRSIIHSSYQHTKNGRKNKNEIQRRYKHIVVDRLCQFASSPTTSSHTNFRNFASYANGFIDKDKNSIYYENESEKYDFCLAEMLCSILVSLTYDNDNYGDYTLHEECSSTMHGSNVGGEWGDIGMDLMILVQKLLFASSIHPASANHLSLSSCIRGCAGAQGSLGNKNMHVGLILAKHVMHSPRLSSEDRDTIVTWVLRILAPTVVQREDGGLNNASVDPVVGYWGIIFLCSLCPVLGGQFKGGSRDLLFQTSESRNLLTKQYGLSKVFKHIKSIVTKSGLVQLESKFQKDKEQRQKKNEIDVEINGFLAFENVPSCFEPHGKTNIGGRQVVICVASFLRSTNGSERHAGTPDHDCSATLRYVHCLISSYLKMGRLISKKWSSKGWLLAKIELPNFLRNKDKTKNDVVELRLDSVEQKKEYHEEYRNVKVDSLVSRIEVYIISIGFLTAVLENVFNHYKKSRAEMRGDKEGSDENLFNLIQYQLAKIYCLRDRCAVALDVLAGAECSMTKKIQINKIQGRRNGLVEENVVSVFRQGDTCSMHLLPMIVQKLRGIVPIFFRDVNYMFVNILWNCVSSLEHSAIMKESNSKVTSRVGSSNDYNVSDQIPHWNLTGTEHVRLCAATRDLLNFQVSVLKHLTTISRSITDDIGWFCEERQRQINCTAEKDLDQYCRILPNLVNTNGLQGLWRTVIPWLPYLKKISQTSPTKSSYHNKLQIEVMLFTQVKGFIMSAFPLIHNTMEISILLESTFGFPQMKLLPILYDNRHQIKPLDRCADAPTLKYVCVHIIDKISLCEDSTVARGLLDILSILSVQEKTVIPYVHKANWVILISNYAKFDDGNKMISSDGDKLPHSFVQSVLTSLTDSHSYANTYKSTFQQVLLSLVKCGTKSLHEFKDCSTLCCSLLSNWGIAGGIGSEFCKETLQLVIALELNVNRYSRDVNKVAKKREKRQNLIIPSLDGRSYPMTFEVLLHQIVASLLLSQPQCSPTSESGKLLNATEKSTPYRDILDFIHAFDSTLQIFSCNVSLFPKHFISTTIKACHLMLKTCEYQVENCIRWRSTQVPPKVIKRRIRNSDDTSIDFLKSLLHSMRSNCVGSIVNFCGKLTDIDKTLTSVDIIDIPTNIKRAAANLVAHCQKLVCTLFSTSASYHLLPPSLECLGDTKLISLDSNNGKLGASTTPRKGMVLRRKINPNSFKRNHDVQTLKVCKNQDEEHNESSEESSFKVTGDWGDDCSNGDDSSCDISSSFNLEIAT